MMNEWIISSSLLIAAVLLGRFLLRGRISLRLQYGLWAVVLLRLLVPIQIFTSDFGAGSIAADVDISAPVRQVYVSANEDHYEREYDAAYQEVVARYKASQLSYDPIAVEDEARTMAQASMELDLRSLLYHLWFAGMVVMTAVIVSCNVHLGLQLKRRRWELPVSDCLLPVYVTEAVPTPCIFGFFRPAIYLTPDAAGDETVRRHVLQHELTHYRHLDHVWSVLRSVCLVLHWYNPLVWAAAKVSRADAELACDEGALKALGESQRGDYGRTLIGLTCSDHVGSVFLTATTMTGSAGSIRERIALLMQRPRNTLLALIAVVLVGVLVVGCTFAAAPEATVPVESTAPETTPDETTEPTGHTPDNDMSYQGTELPIPENPGGTATPIAQADIFNADGILTFPGFDFFMTEEEVLAALGISPEQCFEYQRTNAEGMEANCFSVNYSDAFGVPMKLTFTFRSYWSDEAPGLTEIYGDFENQADFEAVRSLYAQVLGETDAKMIAGIEERWDGDVTLQELVGKKGYEILDRCAVNALNVPASYVKWLDNGSDSPGFIWFTELPDPSALAIPAVVTALFGENADPWYLAALITTYADQYSFDEETFLCSASTGGITETERALLAQTYGEDALRDKAVFRMTVQEIEQVLYTYLGLYRYDVDLSGFLFCPDTGAYLKIKDEDTALPVPNILSCEMLAENQVRMVYTLPGNDQRRCATLLKGENWKVYSNHLLVEKPLDARALTEAEIAQVREAFQPSLYDETLGEGFGNPLACFTHSMYEDISEMTKFDFLSYFPATGEGTKEELALLIEKYPDYFGDWTTDTMPLPVNRHDAEALDALMLEYTGIRFRDLPDGRWSHYLKETNSYYNYTSDFGLKGFHCTAGWVYDGGAMLCTNDSVLYLTERNGQYFIQAHIPALVAE